MFVDTERLYRHLVGQVFLQSLKFGLCGVTREKNILYGPSNLIGRGINHGFSGVAHYFGKRESTYRTQNRG